MDIIKDIILSSRRHAFWRLLAGPAARRLIGSRRFRHRGVGGLPYFPSYLKAVIVTGLEWAADTLARVMILAALAMLIYRWLAV